MTAETVARLHRVPAGRQGLATVKPRRPSSSARGYDRAWERARAAFLRRTPDLRCGICGACFTVADLTTKGAIHVDHITPLAAGGARFDHANLRATHSRCHNRRSWSQGPGKGKPARGCGPDGLPSDPNHAWRRT